MLEKRSLSGWQWVLVGAVAVGCSLFHLSLGYFGILESLRMRAAHLLFLLPLAFLLYPASKKSPSQRYTPADLIWFGLSMFCCLYIAVFEYERLVSRVIYIDPLTRMDLGVSLLMILCTFEATRRCVGLPLVIVAAIALLYALFGERLPGAMGHTGFSLEWVIEHLALTTEGIFGIPVGASATFVFLFVLFGNFLQSSGAGHSSSTWLMPRPEGPAAALVLIAPVGYISFWGVALIGVVYFVQSRSATPPPA
ncbi:MAG: TRAP transporter large permease subunit [Syntrophaceae bacterium]|nr:TRAP transporter large permease subunit [Syntrophaceae bacterium]